LSKNDGVRGRLERLEKTWVSRQEDDVGVFSRARVEAAKAAKAAANLI
jgi:hypothetical protein